MLLSFQSKNSRNSMSEDQHDLPIVDPDENNQSDQQNVSESSTESATEPAINVGVTAEILEIINISDAIKQQLSRVIVGQTDLMDLMIIAILTKGHILIEGVPGVAKH